MKINNHPTKETREKMSRAHKGKHISPAAKKKMSETMKRKTKLVDLLPAFPMDANGKKLSQKKARELVKMIKEANSERNIWRRPK